MRMTTTVKASGHFRRYVPGGEEIVQVLLLIAVFRFVLWLLEKAKLVGRRRAVRIFRVALIGYVLICFVISFAGG